MKIALIAVGCLLLIVAVVIAVGALLPKRHSVTRSAVYSAAPEALWALIEGTQAWRPDVVNYEALPSVNDRRFVRETTKGGDVVTYELLQINPPLSLQLRIATDNLPYSGSWSFSLQREGKVTRVRITEDGEVYNPFFRFVSRFIIGQNRTIDAYLTALGSAMSQSAQIAD